jgi:hypothetical protein
MEWQSAYERTPTDSVSKLKTIPGTILSGEMLNNALHQVNQNNSSNRIIADYWPLTYD